MSKDYQICTECVMDTSDPNITFDSTGVCTHTRRYKKRMDSLVKINRYNKENLALIIADIKNTGKDEKYDCLIGLSGGIDSSYMLYQAHQLGLRPLCVHLDNGWNSKIAVKNIEKMVRKFKFDLYTHVIDWEEFKDLQRAFFKASVVDIEMLTDHAIVAFSYGLAIEKNIKHVLIGSNMATENTMPYAWTHIKHDLLNILDIHNKFGKIPLKTFPCMDGLHYEKYMSEIVTFDILNYVDYQKDEAKKILMESCGWRDYGNKHEESLFTKIYQNYILPEKFGIDKRRAHYSSMIHSGLVTREEALAELQKPLYEDAALRSDKEYLMKKWDFDAEEFESIMKEKPKKHTDYFSGYGDRV